MNTMTLRGSAEDSPRRLTTGVESIDREHTQLLDHESRLASICASGSETCHTCDVERRGQCNLRITEIYEAMLNLLIEHFYAEEKLMSCLPWPLAEAHKCEHAELSERLVSLTRPPAGSAILAKPSMLREIVRDWLSDHIVRWDVPLAKQITRRSPNRETGFHGQGQRSDLDAPEPKKPGRSYG